MGHMKIDWCTINTILVIPALLPLLVGYLFPIQMIVNWSLVAIAVFSVSYFITKFSDQRWVEKLHEEICITGIIVAYLGIPYVISAALTLKFFA